MERDKKASDEDKNNLVLCTTTEESKPAQEKTKRYILPLTSKTPTPHASLLLPTWEMGKMCYINGDSFYIFTKITWLGDIGATHNTANNDTGMFYIEQID